MEKLPTGKSTGSKPRRRKAKGKQLEKVEQQSVVRKHQENLHREETARVSRHQKWFLAQLGGEENHV